MTGSENRGTPTGGARVVYTIGHSTRSLEEVVAMLRAHDVTDLVDVRSFPSSRKHPQWNRSEIETSLPSDVRYHWIRELGGRRHTPAGTPSPNDGWRVKAFRDYADYMAGDAFRHGLRELLAIAAEGTPAIMCSEAVPWRCHRRLITDALLVRGVRVRHIISPIRTTTADLTPFARVDGDRITYPADADPEVGA
ncbi:DUF488 family protein [Agromyces archimandritae]|uniref:DUF488 domain-containing protein n=1 Tax=Agromyces archimandritae TaxID=2781962 RepID=A0A975INY3_9MICO|nr:DUF488 domain-containing protein [Agromyces archimandritae]QTX04714.1 DUF488 domain-containing protein [Agromyces archimandritae]